MLAIRFIVNINCISSQHDETSIIVDILSTYLLYIDNYTFTLSMKSIGNDSSVPGIIFSLNSEFMTDKSFANKI